MAQSSSPRPHPAKQLFLLGGLRADEDGRSVALPAGQPRLLLALLALSPQPGRPREQISDTLWPEAPIDRAARYLSNALYRLRKTLGAGWLHVDGDRLALLPTVWVDQHHFEQLARSHQPDDWQRGVAAYSGDLLPEIYADWVLPPRVALREQYLRLIVQLGELAASQGRWAEAVGHYQRLASTDPLNEAAQRGRMQALAALGQASEALEAYAHFAAMLEAELGVAPAPETHALADTLKRELQLSRAASRPNRPPFVGRATERSALLERLQTARAGQGGLVVVLGEAGLGKTRLLQELEAAAGWRGWQVAWGYGEEFVPPAPLAPMSGALRAALPTPRRQQLAQRVAPAWLAQAAQLIPELDQPGQPAPPQTSTDYLSPALRHVLTGLQAIRPQLLMLDDVQWADAAIWPLLETLREPFNSLSVLVVVSGRRDELGRQPEAWAHLERWDRAGVPLIHLSGLSDDELGALAGERALTPEALASLSAASGGNPLLALTLLNEKSPLPLDAAPPSLSRLFEQQLQPLAPPTRSALAAAAVIGYRFGYEAWQATTREVDLALCAGELEQAGLLHLERDGYRFAHDTLRSVVYSAIPAPERRALHQAALSALAGRAQAEAHTLLYHAEQAELPNEVGRYALQAGEKALAVAGYAAAARHFSRALVTLPPDAPTQRWTALLGRLRAWDVLGDRAAQAADVDQLGILAEALNSDEARAEAAWQAANLQWVSGQYRAARRSGEAGLVFAQRAGDRQRQARLLEYIGRADRDLGDYARANEAFARARDCYAALGDELGLAWIDGMLGLVALRLGRYGEAQAFHQRAMTAHQHRGDPFNEMRAASGLGVTLWALGDYVQAQTIFQRTLRLSREVGDQRMQEASLANLGGLADLLGDYASALPLKEAGLALSRAAGNPMGIAIGLSNLGITHYNLGQYERSLACFEEAIAIDRATGRRQGEAYALHGRGMTLLALDQLAEARDSLEAARALRAELAERDTLIATDADLAMQALAANDPARARIHLAAAQAALQPADRPTLRQQVHYAAYRVHLAEAAPRPGARAPSAGRASHDRSCRGAAQGSRRAVAAARPAQPPGARRARGGGTQSHRPARENANSFGPRPIRSRLPGSDMDPLRSGR